MGLVGLNGMAWAPRPGRTYRRRPSAPAATIPAASSMSPRSGHGLRAGVEIGRQRSWIP